MDTNHNKEIQLTILFKNKFWSQSKTRTKTGSGIGTFEI